MVALVLGTQNQGLAVLWGLSTILILERKIGSEAIMLIFSGQSLVFLQEMFSHNNIRILFQKNVRIAHIFFFLL